MNVVLAHGWGNFSLAAASLAATLRARRDDVEVWVRSYLLDHVDTSFLRDCYLLKPGIVGLSCHFWNLEDALRIARVAKEILPDVLVVLGGPEAGSPTAAAQLLEREAAVDIVVLGEGEESFCRVVDAWVAGEVPRLAGTAFRQAGSVVTRPPDSAPDLQALPDVFVDGEPLIERLVDRGGMIAYETQRGCRRQCSYCLYCASEVRLFPLARVLRELTFICRRRVPAVRFTDSHFGHTRERALAILNHLAAVNVSTHFSLYPDPRHLDREYVSTLDRAGCKVISLGLQSASRAVLRRGERQGEEDLFIRALDVLRAGGVEPQVDLILGLPGESYDSFAETLSYLGALGVRRVLFSHLMCFADTGLASRAEEHGIEVFDVPAHFVKGTKWISEEDFARCYALCAWFKLVARLVCTSPFVNTVVGMADLPARLAHREPDTSLVMELLDLFAPAPPGTLKKKLRDRFRRLQNLVQEVLREAGHDTHLPMLDELLRLDCLLLELAGRRPIQLGREALPRSGKGRAGLPDKLPLHLSPRVVLCRFSVDARGIANRDPSAWGRGRTEPLPYLGVHTTDGPRMLLLDALDETLLLGFQGGKTVEEVLSEPGVRGKGGNRRLDALTRIEHWVRNMVLCPGLQP